MSSGLETLILSGLIHIPDYQIKVLPHLTKDIFEQQDTSVIFEQIRKFYEVFDKIPTYDVLDIEIDGVKGISEDSYQSAKELIKKLFSTKLETEIKKQDLEWMLSKSEKYVKERSATIAVLNAYNILSGENKKATLESIPDLLQKAVNITFDNDVGHDYINDCDKRFDFYHDVTTRIPFHLTMFNHITKGGIPKKTLVVPVASTGVGKSLFMTDWAAYLLSEGYNVLYVTLELAEERIGERIDAKLLNLTIDELHNVSKTVYSSKINTLKQKSLGKLIIKEYPTGGMNAVQLRTLLAELKNKKNFQPDVIMVDYLNIASSYRATLSSGSYTYVKYIAEEFRAVAMQYNCCVISPTQSNRDGINNMDMELTEVSESAGISHTADFMFALMTSAELDALGHMRAKQLKNRFGNIYAPNSFLIGANKPKMTLYDVDLPTTPNTVQVIPPSNIQKPTFNKNKSNGLKT